jgi:hypothetical protein
MITIGISVQSKNYPIQDQSVIGNLLDKTRYQLLALAPESNSVLTQSFYYSGGRVQLLTTPYYQQIHREAQLQMYSRILCDNLNQMFQVFESNSQIIVTLDDQNRIRCQTPSGLRIFQDSQQLVTYLNQNQMHG